MPMSMKMFFEKNTTPIVYKQGSGYSVKSTPKTTRQWFGNSMIGRIAGLKSGCGACGK